MSNLNNQKLTGGLTLGRTYHERPKVDPEVCSPYDIFSTWEGKHGTEEMRLSLRPFNIAQSFPAEFHSPVLSLRYSIWRDDKKGGSGNSINIYIDRKELELVGEVFGNDYERELDLRAGDHSENLQTLLEKARLGSGNGNADKILHTILKNEDLFEGGPLRHYHGVYRPAHYRDARLSVRDIAFYCSNLIGNVIGTLGINRQMPVTVSGAGYVVVPREDYVGLGKPDQLFVRSLSVGQEKLERNEINKVVKKAIRALSLDKSPEEVRELQKNRWQRFLAENRATYVGGAKNDNK